ncbi:MAG TPA: aminoacyl-tRNA hydrolase [Desulfobacteraceae bacterium]|nr:aminoacyl-tRNA hydrolase [Desulfobacteraceae bacterium]
MDRKREVFFIAGLGNPGKRFNNTRHNIGSMVLDALAGSMDKRIEKERFLSRYLLVELEGKKVVMVCPLTYMNRSGEAISLWVEETGVDYRNMLLVHDDLDLPLGRIKAVRKGGAGGHKGVESVMKYLKSDEFNRLKIGIGRPLYGEPIEDFLLSEFYADQLDIVNRVVEVGAMACLWFVQRGIDYTMNRINPSNLLEKKEVID